MKAVFHDIPQAENLWFDMRRGKITASVIKDIMGKNGLLKTAESLAIKIAYESIMTDVDIERFETEDTMRGNEFEPVAIARYEDEREVTVSNGGFFTYKDLGASPDGLVGEDGQIEVKCPRYKGHLRTIRSGTYDPQYYGQMQFQLYVTGRKWCDFISFNLDMPINKQIFVVRVYPDKEYQEKLAQRIDGLRKLIQEYKDILNG